MSFLDGIPEIMLEALKGDLRPGELIRSDQSTKDRYGNPTRGADTAHAIVGIVESYEAAAGRIRVVRQGSEAQREENDVAVFFLLHGVPIDPETGDHIRIDGPRGKGIRYRVISIMDIDPARAGATVQVRPTE